MIAVGLVFAALPIGAAFAQVRFDPAATANERAVADADGRLALNPRDLQALRDAAQAAMNLGDVDRTVGYIARAESLAPGDPVIKAARAAVHAHRGRPDLALRLFMQADATGARPGDFALDRGLAYDLIGDQPSAQYYYALAQRQDFDGEASRRYALSLAIMGDFAAGDAMLRPLLARQDRAAWRIRAFMLAVSGREEEAIAVLRSTLPDRLASSLAPYMRGMNRLSRAQQAAAAHLGVFPTADQIAPQAGADSGTVPGLPGSTDRTPRRRPGRAVTASGNEENPPPLDAKGR